MLRDYQEEAVAWLAVTRRGIAQCPAGGGKTLIASAGIDRVARSIKRTRKVRVTWIANTREQCEQARAALATFPAIEELCTIRVCCAQAEPDCSQDDLIVVDECHHAGSPSWHAVIEKCPGARWGLSATPLGLDPDKNMAMLDLFNYQLFEIKRERVVNGGHLTKARVFLHGDTDLGVFEAVNAEVPMLLDLRMKKFPHLDESEQRQRITWQLCQRHGIAENGTRNWKIVSLCRKHKDDSVLILVGTVDHGQTLAREISGAVVCHSGMGIKKRRQAIADFRTGVLKVMIATSLADEGLDVPRAGVLILACAGRSAGKVEQRTGRVLRIFNGKDRGIIHDFIDKSHPMLHAQHKSRLRLYKKLGYEIAQ